jgi:hypothetical protein
MTTRSVSGTPGAGGVPASDIHATETVPAAPDLAAPPPLDGVDDHGALDQLGHLDRPQAAAGVEDLAADYGAPGGLQAGAAALAAIDAFEPARDAGLALQARPALLFSTLDACAPPAVAGHG